MRTKMCPFCWLLCPQTLEKCLEYEVFIYFYQNVCNEWIRKWFWDFIYFTPEFCSLNTEFTPKIYWWLPFGFWWKEDPPVLPEFYTGKKIVIVRSTCRIWGKNNMFFHALGGLAPRDREGSEVRGSPAVWPVHPELLASSAPSFPTRGLAVVMPRLVYRAKGRKRADDQMTIPVWSIHSQDHGEEGGLMGKMGVPLLVTVGKWYSRQRAKDRPDSETYSKVFCPVWSHWCNVKISQLSSAIW